MGAECRVAGFAVMPQAGRQEQPRVGEQGVRELLLHLDWLGGSAG